MDTKDATGLSKPPNLEFSNRLFGDEPESIGLPFSTITPTLTCSSLVLKKVCETTGMGLGEVCQSLAEGFQYHREHASQSWSPSPIDKKLGVDIGLLMSKGIFWEHAPLTKEMFAQARLASLSKPEPTPHAVGEHTRDKGASSRTDKSGAGVRKNGSPDSRKPQGKGRQMSGNDEKVQDRSPKITFPAAFVHPYERTLKDGTTIERAVCSIPKGTKVNNVDLGGYGVDVAFKDFHKQNLLAGKQVTFIIPNKHRVAMLNADGSPVVGPDGKKAYQDAPGITVFKRNEDGTRETLVVDAWKLTKAVKAEREAFAAEKAAERGERGQDSSKEGSLEQGATNERLQAQLDSLPVGQESHEQSGPAMEER